MSRWSPPTTSNSRPPPCGALTNALLCIEGGAFVDQEDRRRVTPEHWFKSADDMRRAVRRSAGGLRQHPGDRPALRLHGQEARSDPPELPTEAGRTEAEELAAQARAGLRLRLDASPPDEGEDVYWTRLEREIGVIQSMGFSGYFLIVSDFMKWSVAHDIPVGPGRGSGAGSLVAWSLLITGIDPIRFGPDLRALPQSERVSMPDFDIDFCQERREEVIAYVQSRYGADRVAQIITFGSLQARAVLRDVGRVMQLPLGLVDRLAKMIPNNPAPLSPWPRPSRSSRASSKPNVTTRMSPRCWRSPSSSRASTATPRPTPPAWSSPTVR